MYMYISRFRTGRTMYISYTIVCSSLKAIYIIIIIIIIIILYIPFEINIPLNGLYIGALF